MKRHSRNDFFVVGEGILFSNPDGSPGVERPSTEAEHRKFRFSRLGPKGVPTPDTLRIVLANAMVTSGAQQDAGTIPAGYTYLGQFIDHDLTLDRTSLKASSAISVSDLISGRSPALDLDSVYGMGPDDPDSKDFYKDGIRFKMGRTARTGFPDSGTNIDMDGFDLPRSGFGSTKAERRRAVIADHRNDENLVVAQTHLAFLRFHNRVVETLSKGGTPSALLFERARETVVQHYQWMIKTDYLPRIVEQNIIDDVFKNGRKIFEPRPKPGDTPTMPIEFSVAAFRLGHSQVRDAYQWNRVFKQSGPGPEGTLQLLFRFSGTSGTLSPDEAEEFERLPTNWIADLRRLYDFATDGYPQFDGAQATDGRNVAKQIDTLLANPLGTLPSGSFGDEPLKIPLEANLAFRNLTRASGLELASGQQMAQFLNDNGVNVTLLSEQQIIDGQNAATFSLSGGDRASFLAATPLWFYVLREAELNGGKMTGVGGRIVAEVFHRAMEGSTISILRSPAWTPDLGAFPGRFLMTDLLNFAFEGKIELLNPLGDGPPVA
jgi:hypothetical protein